MFIELYIKGQVVKRIKIEDYPTERLHAGFWENVKARQIIADFYLSVTMSDYLRAMELKGFGIQDVSFGLAFESKLR